MAVVVQRYVPAEWAGVCFTADPVRLALSQMVLNAHPGVGEEVVSGSVTPTEIVLDRKTGSILRKRRGEVCREVPDAVVREIWKLSLELAEAFDFPQDIEWVATERGVQILQSRPITTMAPEYYHRLIEPWQDVQDEAECPDRLWSRVYADEIWSSPISPLFYDVQNLSGTFGQWRERHGDRRPLPGAIFRNHKAAAYVDVEVLKEAYEYHPRLARVDSMLSFFPPEMRERVRKAPFRWWGRFRRTLRFEWAERDLRSLRRNHTYLASLWPDFVRRTDRWYDRNLDTLDDQALGVHFEDVMGEYALVGPPCECAVLYHATDLMFLLTGVLERWFGDGDALYAKVSCGLEGSKAVWEADQIWQFGERARAGGPGIVAAMESAEWQLLESGKFVLPQGDSIIEDMLAFWRAHRHRGASYKDLVYPRWGDRPESFLALVKSQIRSPSPRPKAVNAQQAGLRRKTQEQLLEQLRGPLGPVRRSLLRWLFRYNEIYMMIRDDHRYYFDRNWYELRRIYCSYGRRLVERKVLVEEDDVFFLSTAEVAAALRGELSRDAAAARVDVRRGSWRETLRHQPPKYLRGNQPYDGDSSSDSDRSRMRGLGASAGFVEGRARIAYTLEDLFDADLNGEILVTRQTDPSWTPYFPRIAGLILETGGVLAHGTSLCREYGVPCVTAIERATEKISNGAWIRIDGSLGTVEVLDVQTK